MLLLWFLMWFFNKQNFIWSFGHFAKVTQALKETSVKVKHTEMTEFHFDQQRFTVNVCIRHLSTAISNTIIKSNCSHSRQISIRQSAGWCFGDASVEWETSNLQRNLQNRSSGEHRFHSHWSAFNVIMFKFSLIWSKSFLWEIENVLFTWTLNKIIPIMPLSHACVKR